jgi:uncharacterized protein (DUF488 family)
MLYTLGHSTLTTEEFLELARPLDVILDVRAFPGSRRFPHFAREQMAGWLEESGLVYQWWPQLGGRRSRVEAPPGLEWPTPEESGWRDPSFAAYALLTTREEWLGPMEKLMAWAGGSGRPALGLLCAEVLWWRCHRSLIADYLVWRGLEVSHLRPGSQPQAHSGVAAGRLARYHPAILDAWERWRSRRLSPPGDPAASG